MSPNACRCRRTRSCSEAEAKKYSCRSRSSWPAGRLVAGVEDLARSPRRGSGRHSAPTWSPGLKASSRSGSAGARRPQPQRVDVLAAPADHRRVVGDRLDRLGRVPDWRTCAAVGVGTASTVPPKPIVVDHLGPLELPGVAERQPVLGIFVLPAVDDHLAEQAVVVADAVAVRGNAERGHAFHEAGGEPAEAAIAERRVRLASCAAGRDRRRARPAPRASCSVRPRLFERCRTAGGRSGIPATGSRPRLRSRRRPARVRGIQRSTTRSRTASAVAMYQSCWFARAALADRIGELLDDVGPQGLDVVVARGGVRQRRAKLVIHAGRSVICSGKGGARAKAALGWGRRMVCYP